MRKAPNQIGMILELIGYRGVVEDHPADEDSVFRHEFCVAGILGNGVDDAGHANAGSAHRLGTAVGKMDVIRTAVFALDDQFRTSLDHEKIDPRIGF